MEQGTFDFSVLDSEDTIPIAVDYFFENAYNKDQVFQKVFSQKFFSEMYHYFENQKKSGQTRFYTLQVLKQLILRNDKKVIVFLSTSQQFLELLEKIALTTDPKKPLSEKGKTMFKNDQQGKFGNNFMRLLLETILYLGTKYGNASKGGPTRFKKILMNLEENNITLPKENKYYPAKKSKDQQPQPAASKKQQKIGNNDKNQKNTVSIPNLIRFITFKIDEYMATLQEIEETNQLEQYINKSHQIFDGQLTKLNQIGQKVYEEEESIVMSSIKVRGFLQQENQLYKKYISKGDYGTFYNQIRILYPQIFEGQDGATPAPPPPKQRSLKPTQSVMKEQPKQQVSRNMMNNPRNSNVQPQFLLKDSLQTEIQGGSDGKTSKMVGQIFRKMQSRSKSPVNGFRLVKESLQKQKHNIHANPPRQRQNRTNSASRIAASTLTRTGMKTPSIFKNVPNSNPSYKNYEGDLVMVSKQLQQILYDIKKEQGSKRFKISNLRDKYILFENQSIQIGFKSEAIFQQYDGFNTFLSIELFFGNKSSRQIKDLEVSYEGDQNTLIYTSPREIRSTIDPQTQLKHQLMLVPLKVPYNFINMKFYYVSGSVPVHSTVAIPNSILKMSTHIQISPTQFHNYHSNTNKTFKTQIFKLSHHFPPNSLRKYIPALQQLSIDFTGFCVSGNDEDYQLYCITEIWQNYEGVLKIIIRPDLTAILQMSAIDPSQDATKHLKVYLQTLQMVLQGS